MSPPPPRPRCRCASRAQLRTRGAPLCGSCHATSVEQRVRKYAQLALGAVGWRRWGDAQRGEEVREGEGGVVAVVPLGQEGRAMLHLLSRVFLSPSSASSSKAPQLKHITVLVVSDARSQEEEREAQRESVRQALREEGEGSGRISVEWISVGEEEVECDARGENIYLCASSSSPSSSFPASPQPHQPRPAPAPTPSALSCSQALHSTLVHSAVLSRARALGAAVLLLPSCADCLASQFLDALVEGNGGSAGMRVGDGWIDDLLILRPLRALSAKEVAFYVHTQRLSYHVSRSTLEGMPSRAFKGTMRGMTEQLIRTLQQAAPSTPATVIRTASKLHFAGHVSSASAAATSLRPLPGHDANASTHAAAVAVAGASASNSSASPPQPDADIEGASQAQGHAASSASTSPPSLAALAARATLAQGAAAQRFVLAALELPVWRRAAGSEAGEGEGGAVPECVLCLLPAPASAPTARPAAPPRAAPLPLRNAAADSSGDSRVEISTLLCAACRRLLETPQVQARGEVQLPLRLPAYVLRKAEARLAREAGAGRGGRGGVEALLGFGAMGLEEGKVLEERGRILRGDEMREKVGEYLL